MDGGLPASAARAQGARFPYLPREQRANFAAAAGVTNVTGCSSMTPAFFGQRVIPLSIQKMTVGLYPCGSHNRLTLAKIVRVSCIHPG
jgi:hypothetical protein